MWWITKCKKEDALDKFDRQYMSRNTTYGTRTEASKTLHAAYQVGPCLRSNSFLMYAATSCYQTNDTKRSNDWILRQFIMIIKDQIDCRSLQTVTKSTHSSYLFYVIFRQCFWSRIHRVLLHFVLHISVLNHCFSLLAAHVWISLKRGRQRQTDICAKQKA